MKKLLLLLITFTSLTVFSQKVEILNKADVKNLAESKKFAFVEPATDTGQIQYVATFLAKDKNRKSVIETLYFAIREQATKVGANCYKIKSFARDTLKHESVLILDSYFATESLLNANRENYEKNVVFIFGAERDGEKTMSFNLNGETKEIKSGTYYKISLKEGEEIKVSKGGVVGGESMRFNWEKDKQPAFYSLSGFGLSDWSEQQRVNSFQGSAIAFNTGRINRIGNISLGLLLTQLLKQGNEQ
jgi:hypothetical protein